MKTLICLIALSLAASAQASRSASGHLWLDADADGLPDVYTFGSGSSGRDDALLRNLGDGQFADVTLEAGLAGLRSRQALVEDFDADERADLLLVTTAGELLLFRGQAGGAFAEAVTGNPAGNAVVERAEWIDYDRDGWRDVGLELAGGGLLILHNLDGVDFERVELGLQGAPVAPALAVAAPGATGTDAVPVHVPKTSTVKAPDGGRRPVLAPATGPSTSGGSESASVPPGSQDAEALPFVALALRDQGYPDQSIMGSTVPTLGMLYPLSSNLFVAPNGTVGIGTTTPYIGVRLHVEGKALFGENNLVGGASATLSGGRFNTASGSIATVAGGQGNGATGSGSVVGGGTQNTASGPSSVVGGGDLNSAYVDYATVSGGSENSAGFVATVAGGDQNEASGSRSVIGGGTLNQATALFSTVGGGQINLATGTHSTIGGGTINQATTDRATIGGGAGNDATALGATIGGGTANDAGGFHATVAGGEDNDAFGDFATIPGGNQNDADGNHSFAAGRYATAGHAGAFVWSDSNGDGPSDTAFASTAMDQFLIDAAGGVGIGTNNPLARLHVEGDTGEDVLRVRIAGQTRLMLAANGALSVGANVGSPAFDLQIAGAGSAFGGTAGKPGGGSWSVSSDRRLKQNVAELDGSLERLLALRGVTYEYIDPDLTNELPGMHTGMIAQEVQQVFPDWVKEAPDGYLRLTFRGFEALTVEALRELRAEKDAEIEAMRTELAALRRLVEEASPLASSR